MFTLPELPYAFDSLEPYIDRETMTIHHGKHHASYVQNLNDVLTGLDDLAKMEINELIANLDKVPEEIRTKVKNNGGGHANHSFFWTNMAPNTGGEPKGELIDAIKANFGDFATFQEKFTAAGMGRFGSGWVWLVLGKRKLSIIDTPNQDSPITGLEQPILGLDVWEHAYYLKYQNRRSDYIKAWWNVVNWGQIEKNFKKTV